MQLVLGTAQFGGLYGVTNPKDQLTIADISAILGRALSVGVGCLDTAHAYGNAQYNLGVSGLTHPELAEQLPVVSKLPPSVTAAEVNNLIAQSQQLLAPFTLDAMLFHRFEDACDQEAVAALSQAKQAGLLKQIGVSLYHPEQFYELVKRWQPDLIQIPMNIFDQRFATQGVLDYCVSHGIAVHVRSLFLQGVLLAEQHHQQVKSLQNYSAQFAEFFDWLHEQQLEPLTACFAFATKYPQVHWVLGAYSADQVQQWANAIAHSREPSTQLDFRQFAKTEPELILPYLWSAS